MHTTADALQEPRRPGSAPGQGAPATRGTVPVLAVRGSSPCGAARRATQPTVPHSPPCRPCSRSSCPWRAGVPAACAECRPCARGRAAGAGVGRGQGVHVRWPCHPLCLPRSPRHSAPAHPGAFSRWQSVRNTSPSRAPLLQGAVAATSHVLGSRSSLVPLHLCVQWLSVQTSRKPHRLLGRCGRHQMGASLCGVGAAEGSGVSLAAISRRRRGGRSMAWLQPRC